ncbi:MAG: hypothetical protein WC539_06880 [Nitrospirota bacterium]
MLKRILVFNLLCVLMASCASVVMQNPPDPYQQINTAYEEMRQGRQAAAEKLILSSIEQFKQQNNKAGLAKAYATYGNYHKYAFKTKPIKAPNPQESVNYFKKAIELYTELGNKNSIAKCHLGIADALIDTDKKTACEHYDLALQNSDDTTNTFSLNPEYKSFSEMIQSYKKEFCGDLE